MAVAGGSQRFSVQLNLNWFVFNTGDFFPPFKEVALQKENRQTGARRTLRRDGGSLLQNSSNSSVRGKSQHLPLMPIVKLKWIGVNERRTKLKKTAKSCIWFFWRDEIAHKKAVLALFPENDLVMFCGICSNQRWSVVVNSGNTKYEQIIKKQWINYIFFHSAEQDHNTNHHHCDTDVNGELLCSATLFFCRLSLL